MDLLGRATLTTAALSAALPEDLPDLSAPFSGADFSSLVARIIIIPAWRSNQQPFFP